MLYMNQSNRDSKIRLVLLDEAFSKMDKERSEVCLHYARELELQLIVCVPDERLQSLIRNVEMCIRDRAYADAYDECELDIVSRPEIDVVQIEKGKDFIFTATVATKPEVTLGEYKGLEVDKVSTRVTQKEVDAKIQEEAEKNARTITVEDRAVQDLSLIHI